MLPLALNHMTVANTSTSACLKVAQSLGCVGVELRNDLQNQMFDGKAPAEVLQEARQLGLRILVLAEVYAFNDNTSEKQAEVLDLIKLALECGAEAIALIPRIANNLVERDTQRTALKAALTALQPMLEDNNMVALIEPLGFANSSLRFKADVVSELNEMNQPRCFGLIHDTFHHALSGETEVFAEFTKIVHVSGVSDPLVDMIDMTDAHRGLVDQKDRLGNITQITRLRVDGFTGPISFEVFSPEIHKLTDPTNDLSTSTAFINSQVAQMAA